VIARTGLDDIGDQERLGARQQRSQMSDLHSAMLLLQLGVAESVGGHDER
jgi:hypothetical protein